jgi:hypothetical protein
MSMKRFPRSKHSALITALVALNIAAAFAISRRLEAQSLPCFISFNCYCQSVESGSGFCGDGPDKRKSCLGNFMCGGTFE